MKKRFFLPMILSAAFAVSAMLTELPVNVLSRGPENAVIAQAADGDEPSPQDAFLAVYPEPELYLADSLGRGMIDPNTLRPDPDFPDVYDEGMDHPFIYDTLAQCVIDPNDGYGAALDISAGLWTFWQRFSSLDFTINSEVELYEVLIMDFLTYQMEQSSYKSDFIKKTAKFGWKIQNSLLKNCVNLDEQTLINLVESTEPLTDEQKQYFNTVSHDLGILQTMQEYTSLLNELEGLAQTGKKAYENYMKALAIKEADDERKAFLYAMKSYVTDNPAFCTAIDNVIETLEATKASLIFDIPLEEFCKYAVKEGWSAFTKLNPLFAPLKLYGTGLDVLFNNDDQAANYYKLVLMHELEQYVKQSVYALHMDYLNDRTQDNASAFVGGYRSYLMFQAYASNWCRGYVSDAVYEGLANKLCNLVSNEADATYAFYQNEINQDMALCSELLSYLEQWTDRYYNFLDASYSGIDDSGSGSTDPDDPGNGSGGSNQAETDEPKDYGGGFDYGKLHYEILSETTYYVRGFANGVNGRKESSVSIPGTVYLITETETKPYRVTGIYSRAFRDYTNLTSVSICSSIRTIPSELFKGCTNLRTVTSNAVSIGDWAFAGCSRLTSITANSPSIGSGAFAGCSSLTYAPFISNISSIPYAAYSGIGITSMTPPANISSIGDYAFSGCANLRSVTIPSTVLSVGDSAFADCTNLRSFTIESADTDYSQHILEGCESLETVSMAKLPRDFVSMFRNYSAYPDESSKFYSIYHSVYNEGDLFYIPKSFKHIIVTDGDSIGYGVFQDFSSLTDVTLADSITSIESSAFENCTGLTEITFSGSMTSIQSYAFAGCTGLSELTIRNKSCSFGSGSVPAEIAICGWLGSTAQAYAEQNGNTFIPLDAPSISTQPNGIRAAIGTTAKFTVTAVGADLSYQWQYNSGSGWKNSNGTGAKTNTLSIGVTAARNGWKYRCILTDRYGRQCTTSVATLKVKTAVTAQPKSLSAPIGEAVNFTVTATGVGLTYQWQYNKGEGWKTSNGTGSKTNTLTINTAAGYNNYQYRCVITDVNGVQTVSDAAKLTVKTVITTQPNGINTAVGTTAKFTVAASGVGLKYQWQYNSGDGWKKSGASGATTATLSINAKTTYNGWKYRCVITDANGATTTSSVATLKIKAAITAQPANTSAVINEAAKFTVKATGIGLTYQWQYNSGDGWKNSGASGNKTAELTIYGKTAYNGWQFRCVVTDEIGTKVISTVAVFKVKTNITAQPASVEAASGTAAKFTVKATGLNLTYQWQYNNGSGWKNSNGSGAATDTLTINAKSTYNNWQYRCVITDGNGAKTYSDAAKLTVK